MEREQQPPPQPTAPERMQVEVEGDGDLLRQVTAAITTRVEAAKPPGRAPEPRVVTIGSHVLPLKAAPGSMGMLWEEAKLKENVLTVARAARESPEKGDAALTTIMNDYLKTPLAVGPWAPSGSPFSPGTGG